MFSKSILLTTATLFSSLAHSAVHEIAVGENGLTFEPETVDNVAAGDILIFTLYPNHDVVQGAFDSPCTPSEGGFYSGPFSDTDNGERRFVVNVTDDGPHWWYCSVQRHCQEGMVGGANVDTEGETSIQAYKDAAADVEQAETPSEMSGGQLVREDDLDEITSTAGSPSASGSPTASGSEAPTTTPSESESGAGASSTAAADTVVVSARATGLLGLVIGVVGWLL